MSQILRDLNKLAEKVGAPVVGKNISEQIRALSTHWEGTSHGANIAERVNELRHSNIGGGGGGGAVPFLPIIYTTGLNATVVTVTEVDEEEEE